MALVLTLTLTLRGVPSEQESDDGHRLTAQGIDHDVELARKGLVRGYGLGLGLGLGKRVGVEVGVGGLG